MSPFHDLLAEIECTMVPSAILHRADDVPAVWWEPARPGPRRRFWCAQMQREVEVEFVGRRAIPGSAMAGVRRCSAFEPAEAITCRRACVDSLFRSRWPAPSYYPSPGRPYFRSL